MSDGVIQVVHDFVPQERLLILHEAVQPEHGGVFLRRIEARRQIHIEVARLAQGVGPNAPVLSMIMGVVDNLAGQPAVVPIEAHLPELPSGQGGTRDQD